MPRRRECEAAPGSRASVGVNRRWLPIDETECRRRFRALIGIRVPAPNGGQILFRRQPTGLVAAKRLAASAPRSKLGAPRSYDFLLSNNFKNPARGQSILGAG